MPLSRAEIQQSTFGVDSAGLFHGRYRLVRALKSGGMGAVYEVSDERTGGARALKIIHPDLLQSSPDFRARFALEASITGAIESDHLVRVFDAGVDEPSGIPFLVMELLRGKDLSVLLSEQGRLDPVDACTYLGQASMALDKTHAAGIIHRDLKPDNLFLTRRDDGSPCIKILDFGIAKATDPRSGGVETTSVMGSPLYMAPEQLLLDQPMTPAVDVHGLGQTAYTLLVGEPYWRSEYERASSPIAAAIALSSGIPEPMSVRAKSRNGLDLPPAMDAWFATCVARRPEERFSSASQAIVALAEALGLVRPSSPAPEPARSRPSEPVISGRQARSVPSPDVAQTGVRRSAAPRPRSGFSVEIDPLRKLARLAVWGFWSVEQGKAFLDEFRGKTKPLWGGSWFVLADISEFPAQRPEVNAYIAQTMELAKKNGCARAANVVSSSLTKMQIARVSQEQGLNSVAFFQDEAAALAWLIASA